jgi:hypothetical protein
MPAGIAEVAFEGQALCESRAASKGHSFAVMNVATDQRPLGFEEGLRPGPAGVQGRAAE